MTHDVKQVHNFRDLNTVYETFLILSYSYSMMDKY
jgi:hypothetical protein